MNYPKSISTIEHQLWFGKCWAASMRWIDKIYLSNVLASINAILIYKVFCRVFISANWYKCERTFSNFHNKNQIQRCRNTKMRQKNSVSDLAVLHENGFIFRSIPLFQFHWHCNGVRCPCARNLMSSDSPAFVSVELKRTDSVQYFTYLALTNL